MSYIMSLPLRRGMAQLVACLLWEQEVPSSSLGAPTMESCDRIMCP